MFLFSFRGRGLYQGKVVFVIEKRWGGYNWSLGCCSPSVSGLPVWPGEGAWGGWVTVGRPWEMGIVLGTIPSTAGGRPPEARLTTPGGYLLPRRNKKRERERERERESKKKANKNKEINK